MTQNIAGPPQWAAPSKPASTGTNVLAVIALVLGIAVPIGGIVCGVIARRQIEQSGEQGDGMALAGIVIGSVLTALTFLMVLLAVIAIPLSA